MWVITRSINQYDQDGDYLVCVFLNKPTDSDLLKIFPGYSRQELDHLLSGGGRVDSEDEWFYLTKLQSGELYVEQS